MLKIHLTTILIIVLTKIMNAQGCSDAGFCSIGAIKIQEHSSDSIIKNSIAVGFGFSVGRQGITYINPYVEYYRKINNKFSLQLKGTSQFAKGEQADVFNVSDLFIAGMYSTQKNKKKWNINAGIKFPLNSANAESGDGFALPLDYQSSLGTVDLIAGVSYNINNKWELSTAFQIPVINSNKNEYLPLLVSDENDFEPTNKFERAADVLLRAGYIIKVKSKLYIKPNILAIYHLANDTYQDAVGNRNEIKSSTGLTINAGGILVYAISQKNNLELVFASPMVVRENRPDGLTRAFAATLQYKVKF